MLDGPLPRDILPVQVGPSRGQGGAEMLSVEDPTPSWLMWIPRYSQESPVLHRASENHLGSTLPSNPNPRPYVRCGTGQVFLYSEPPPPLTSQLPQGTLWASRWGSSGLASVALCLATPLGTKGNCAPGSQRQLFFSGSDGETLSHGRTGPLARAGIRMRGKQGRAGTGLSGREKDGQVARMWVPFSVG